MDRDYFESWGIISDCCLRKKEASKIFFFFGIQPFLWNKTIQSFLWKEGHVLCPNHKVQANVH